MREQRASQRKSEDASMWCDRRPASAGTRCPSFSRPGRAIGYKQRRHDKSVNAHPPHVARITPWPIGWAWQPETQMQRAKQTATRSAPLQSRWRTHSRSVRIKLASISSITIASANRAATVRARLSLTVNTMASFGPTIGSLERNTLHILRRKCAVKLVPRTRWRRGASPEETAR